jgi:hypothetical protein
MESIEARLRSLAGVLPKSEYQELDNAVLGQLLRTLNPDELKRVAGDIFGRIYEYFLTQFADQKAHDGGEFFTPVSLVSADRQRDRAGSAALCSTRRAVRAVCSYRVRAWWSSTTPTRPSAHLLRHGEERHHDPAGQDEPGRARAGRQHPEGHQLL